MPVIRFVPVSSSGRTLDDKVSTFILEGKRCGVIRDQRGIDISSRRFTVDAAPDDYTVQIEINGFRVQRKMVRVGRGSSGIFPIEMVHKSKALPGFENLHPEQLCLLQSLDAGSDPQSIWMRLSENRCSTFFQISYALSSLRLANGRTLASYIRSIRCIGGVEIEDDLPDGRIKRAVGWRIHAIINEEDRERIELDLVMNSVFGDRENGSVVHPTHKKFGLIKSHRERGALPRLQIVLSRDNAHADLDLDCLIHGSSPHSIYRFFKKKFPETADIFRY